MLPQRPRNQARVYQIGRWATIPVVFLLRLLLTKAKGAAGLSPSAHRPILGLKLPVRAPPGAQRRVFSPEEADSVMCGR